MEWNGSHAEKKNLLATLESRFKENVHRHPNLNWEEVLTRIQQDDKKLFTLYEMERTGGEPDVVVFENKSNILHYIDCSKESPLHRRSLCYDDEALEARKENKPQGSAVAMAKKMGVNSWLKRSIENYRGWSVLT